jgi:hypothetical protein
MFDPKQIAKLINEDVNDASIPDAPQIDPEHFIGAVNGLIASAPHGRQQEVINKIAAKEPNEMVRVLSTINPAPTNHFVQDFYKSRGSNIMLVAKLAEKIFGSEIAHQVLDQIDLMTNFEDGEVDEDEDDLYNSEGDGYSH